MRLLSIACAVAIGCAANHGNPHSPASKPRPQRNSSAACPITADTAVVVYTSTSGGVGPNSAEWTRRFFAWWADANPGQLTWLALDDPVAISTDCVFTDFPALRLYVQPGGDALNQSLALGPNGRDNLLNYIYYGYPNSHYMGTCAGAFYGAGSYWWYDNFEVNAFQPHWYPTVEGPITEIAAYPLYKPTTIVAEDGSESLTMIYWGGPASGLDYTTNKVPGTVHAHFADVTGEIPAVATYGSLLFNSPHPEAVEGVGIECDPPLPPGCITSAQRLQNWQYLARTINAHIGSEWVVPTELGKHV